MAIEGLDLETLLAPIEGDQPTGIDVRADFSPASSYFRLRDARADARAAERAADANPGADPGTEGWRNVRTLAVKILSEQAKDLEAAAWLTESLVRSNGLAGLAFGAQLLGGLAERYWDQLYPLPDEDGIPTRVAPVTGLNGEGGPGTLTQSMNKLPLFKDGNGDPVMLFQYEQSAELETIADKKRLEAKIAAGVVPFETMKSYARANPAGAYVALRRNLSEARTAWTAMAEIFDRLAGMDGPPTRQITETLDTVAGIVNLYAPPESAAAPGGDEAAAEETPSEVETGGGGGGGKARKLATREDAFAQLAEIAIFFRRNEPQSPLAYTIEDAIRRGRMTLPELLTELVTDESYRYGILNSLGIRLPEAT